jgi:hypothetical protein
MFKEVTSLADLFAKAKVDKRYKDAAVTAYRASEADYIGGWERAEAWINRWADKNVNYLGPTDTCKNMVNFLNRYIRAMM